MISLKRAFLLSLVGMVSASAFGDCDFRPRDTTKLYENPRMIVEKLETCINDEIADFTFQFIPNSFSEEGGQLTYYRREANGAVLFSEKRFSDAGGAYYYFRRTRVDENTIYSTKEFDQASKHYKYFRKNRGDDHVIWSINTFSEPDSDFIYFREKNGDENTFLSIKILTDGEDRVIYFRTQRGDGTEICSIKNGSYRDSQRNPISGEEFYRIFHQNFWRPLFERTAGATIEFLGTELAR